MDKEKLEVQIEQINSLKEEIIEALRSCLSHKRILTSRGAAKFLYLQTVIDIVDEKFDKFIKSK